MCVCLGRCVLERGHSNLIAISRATAALFCPEFTAVFVYTCFIRLLGIASCVFVFKRVCVCVH